MLEATIPDFVSATWVVLTSKENKLNSPEIATASHSLYCQPSSRKKGPCAAMQIKEFPYSSIYLNPRNCQSTHNHFACNDEA